MTPRFALLQFGRSVDRRIGGGSSLAPLRLSAPFLALLVVLESVVAVPSSAQTIRGELVHQTSGQPIRGGFVILLSDSSVERGLALTDSRGRFELQAPSAGRYRLKSAVIGIRSTISPPIQLATGEVLDYRFEVAGVVVVLPAVVIEEERTCRAYPRTGLAAATLWEEARKALNAVVWTEQAGLLRHRIVRYERELDPLTLELVGKQRSWSQTGLYRASSFGSPPAEKLAADGYIQDAGSSEWIYYGPDAGALLSEVFAGLHCFGVRPSDRAAPDLIGLEFEPIPGRKIPDVRGVLWVDSKTAELRHLEFRYTNPPWKVRSDRIGGRIEFEHLSTGQWIVRRWWLRMPVVGIRPQPLNPIGPRQPDRYLAAIREAGGWVSEINTMDGRPVGRAGAATLEGTVIDSATGAPLAGASVKLLGTIHEVRSDDSGRFRFDDLPEGTYGITYVHEILDGLGFVPPPGEVRVARDQVTTVQLWVPDQKALWPLLCPGTDPGAGVGIVSGFVRDARSREPIAEAHVVMFGAGTPGRQAEVGAVTDWAGYYLACDVPAADTITAEVSHVDWSGAATPIALSPGEILHQDFELVPVLQSASTRTLPLSGGLGFGANVGVVSVGDASGALQHGTGFEGFLRFSTPGGWQLGGGLRTSRHGISNARQDYGLIEAFVEPRFVLQTVSAKVAPFIGGRVGRVWENVAESGADFRATGYTFAASGGFVFRLDQRIVVEAGASLGGISFGDYSFIGDTRWFDCVEEHRALESVLPSTVVACSPPAGTSAPQLIPGQGISGVGQLERVYHPNSGRSGNQRSVWLGVLFSLHRLEKRSPTAVLP